MHTKYHQKTLVFLGISLAVVLGISIVPLPSYAADCSDVPVKNFRGVVFVDGTLGEDEASGGSNILTGYVGESMKHIRESGFNTIRVPYYWEAYTNDPSTFLAEIELIADKAQDNDLCVIYDNHHYYTSSHWNLSVAGKSDGRGFPSFVVNDFVKRGDYIDTAGPFWDKFLSNDITIDGEKVWQVQWEFMSKIIDRVDKYPSVAGYEILNEPHLFEKSDYLDLGNYHTYMAKKIRSESDRKIFFDRETTRGFERDPSMEPRIFPDGVSGTVYAPHLYSPPTSGSQGMKQINNIADWADNAKSEVLIAEWSADSRSEAETFLKAFEANDFGWTAHSWKKSGSGGLGSSLYESDSTSATSALKVLKSAMISVY